MARKRRINRGTDDWRHVKPSFTGSALLAIKARVGIFRRAMIKAAIIVALDRHSRAVTMKDMERALRKTGSQSFVDIPVRILPLRKEAKTRLEKAENIFKLALRTAATSRAILCGAREMKIEPQDVEEISFEEALIIFRALFSV